jgi:hypothetical protein
MVRERGKEQGKERRKDLVVPASLPLRGTSGSLLGRSLGNRLPGFRLLGLVTALRSGLLIKDAPLLRITIFMVDDGASLGALPKHGSGSLRGHCEGLPEIVGDSRAHRDGVVQGGLDSPIKGLDTSLGLVGKRLVLLHVLLERKRESERIRENRWKKEKIPSFLASK